MDRIAILQFSFLFTLPLKLPKKGIYTDVYGHIYLAGRLKDIENLSAISKCTKISFR